MNEELLARCSCSQCGNHIQFPIDAANAVVDCPHCNQKTQLTLDAPPQPDKPSAADILAAFNGSIPRTPVSFLYQVGLVLVTLVMLILPVIYVVLVGVTAWGIWLYGVHAKSILASSAAGGRFYLLRIIAYIAPLFIGLVLVFFMIKPLFAARAPKAQPLALNPGAEPTLYAFIAKICELVGAPMPKLIELDCQLNAAAGFRRGFASMFSNDLILVIGIPVVASFNLREFAGILAHEFGHYTQGFGMRLNYVVRRINLWFARVVFERDAWDLMLESWAEEAGDFRVMIVVNLARLGVWFSRMILLLLMLIGHAVSCFLTRQREYDADSYEIKLSGSAACEDRVRRFALLGEALGKAYKEMRSTWNLSRRLPDNFPAYLMRQEQAIPVATREMIQNTLGLAQTGLFDTHPSDGDRIRRARQAAEPGIFHLDMPASVLFSNFEGASRQITLLHYAEDLGIPCNAAALYPVT
jgi:Zn-dependent protease with chaperone function